VKRRPWEECRAGDEVLDEVRIRSAMDPNGRARGVTKKRALSRVVVRRWDLNASPRGYVHGRLLRLLMRLIRHA
jgi:hypothetical protein